jgi:DNA-3-methyladenine glycosylase I
MTQRPQNLAKIYQLMFDKLMEIQEDKKFDEIVADLKVRTYKGKNDDWFYERLVWSVLKSGFNASIIDKRLKNIGEQLSGFHTEKVAGFKQATIQKMVNSNRFLCGKRGTSKVRACVDDAKVMQQLSNQYGSFERYLESFEPNKSQGLLLLRSDLIKRFDYIGKTTVNHFLKDIGFDVVKDDVHVRRILFRLRLTSSQRAPYTEVCNVSKRIAEAAGERLSLVDEVIWRYGSGVGCNMKVCGRRRKCSQCPVADAHLCNYGRKNT